MRLLLVLPLLGACITARPTMQSLETDRPDFTEASSTVAAGRVQAEAGYTLTHDDGVRGHTIGELLLRAGISRRTELRVGVNSYAVSDAGGAHVAGLEDPTVGMKASLVATAAGARPAMSLIAMSSLPAGADAVSSHRAEPEAKLVLAWELPAGVALGVNANAARRAAGAVRWNERAWSASLARDVGARAGAYFEAFGFDREERGGRATRYLNGGVTVGFGDDLQLDARAGTSIHRASGRARFAGIGIARRW